ncbi:MAG: YeeE/YedE family protein [Myxococcota bacterium]
MVDAVDWLQPLLGGVLIGLSAAGLWALSGRIAGISGMVGQLFGPDGGWRAAFLAGLIAGGALMLVLLPQAFSTSPIRPLTVTAIAGFAVGVGTQLGHGCTSGHGVCGLGRFSARSAAATVVFLGCGIITASLYRWMVGAS